MGIALGKLWRPATVPFIHWFHGVNKPKDAIINLRKLKISQEFNWDEIRNAYKEYLDYAQKKGYTQGKLLINLHFDNLLKEFQLSIVEVNGLTKKYNNLYVKVLLECESYTESGKTYTVPSRDPKWLILFIFQNMSVRDMKTAKLYVEVKNRKTCMDETIGYIYIPLLYIMNQNELLCYKELQWKQRYFSRLWPAKDYQALIGLSFKDSIDVLTVALVTVQNIELSGLFRSCSPCVFVTLYCGKERIAAEMTDIIYECGSPVYNEIFKFGIPINKLVSSHLVFELVNFGYIIGSAMIGTEKGCGTSGFKHWHDLLNNTKTNQHTEYWHPIKKCNERKVQDMITL